VRVYSSVCNSVLNKKFRKCGAKPPLLNTPSWRGAELKAQEKLYL
jgi:hypothetical protein